MISTFRLEFFFFSSRRRHTRLQDDWSSDVCSSDLGSAAIRLSQIEFEGVRFGEAVEGQKLKIAEALVGAQVWHQVMAVLILRRRRKLRSTARSEERRVGKECRSGWWRGR